MFPKLSIRAVTRFGAIVAFCFGTALCGAQMTTRSLSGVVTDGHNEPIKGAVIEARNDVTTSVVSYITGRDGRYAFKRLDGRTDYRLWARYRGQQSKVRKLSRFDSGKPKVVDFVVRPRY